MNKRITLYVALFFLLGFTSHAQILGGIRAGLNLSTFTGKNAGGTTIKPGFHGGAYLKFMPENEFGFQPEVTISLKGTKFQNNNNPNIIDNRNRSLLYVDVPLYIAQNNENFTLLFGPVISFLLEAKENIGNFSTDITSVYRPLEVSLAVGGEYELESGLNFGARALYGVTSILAPSNTTGDQQDIRNIVAMITMGFTIGK